jgi:hypothetical protein
MAVQQQMREDDGADDVQARLCVQAQALIREVNEQIHKLGSKWDSDAGDCSIVCECPNPECLAPLQIPSQLYTDVRAFPTRFLLVPDHVADGFQRVVEAGTNYVVVETVGPAAATAVHLDPRRRGTAR